MERRVEGTFQTVEEAKKEIERLISEEGFQPQELLLVSDKQTTVNESSVDEVEVDVVDALDNGSFWEKMKETLSFGTYQSSEAENALEKHGVTNGLADHYIDALKSGELVLLANTDAPREPELSELNETIIEEENDTMVDKKQDTPVDEVNSEEEEAIKDSTKDENKEPSDVSTSETEDSNVEEGMDPSQANDTRSDDSENAETNLDDDTTTEDDATDPSTNPDLTGEEDTVESEGREQVKEPKIAQGQVKPEAKSPLNAEPKQEKDPSEESEAPEGDAEYAPDMEEEGMKNEKDNK
jgi:hypothetical protein